MDINGFSDILEKSGIFDKLEIKIIRAMFSLEENKKTRNTASIIAKQAKLSVTNAYKYLYSLQQKGLVEYEKNKHKTFWLSRTNPFPRLFSYVTKDYIDKKEMFKNIKEIYNEIADGSIWLNKQIFERYSSISEFINRTSFLFDIAKNNVSITADCFLDDFIILDAIKRAQDRGVVIRILTSDMQEENVELLKKIGVEVRFTDKVIQPFIMVVDSRHGITIEMKDGEKYNGVWFLNQANDYERKFNDLWERAGDA